MSHTSVAVGVEEEFHLVDLRTRAPVPAAGALLEALVPNRFCGELQRCMIESNSRPVTDLADLGRELEELRGTLVDAAARQGLGVVAAGTVPMVGPEAALVTPDPRYQRMDADYQLLVREQLICGAQVHVDVADRDTAVAVAHRTAAWLPVLLALSASSPYWLGADSGYASARTLVWQRWPTAGSPARFRSAREYDQMVADLVASEVISDEGMLYFDVRPSAHLPTVELRVCDACPRLEVVVLLAGLFRALVVQEVAAVRAGAPPPRVRPELLRAATWRAARSGLEGALLDPEELTPVPPDRAAGRLLERLRPTLEALGDWPLVSALTQAALRDGSAAARQREAFARRGDLADVVDLTLAETRAELPATVRPPPPPPPRPPSPPAPPERPLGPQERPAPL